MRTIWNGSISFGLVNIPVGLALATTPKAKQSDVSFRTLHRECRTPIRQKRWCPTHEREVGPDEIVKGWEVAKGEYVIVEDADLEAINQHDDSRSIDITRFVDLDEVDPVYLDRTYYLAPATAAAQRRPYVLLLEAMKQAGMGGIGRFVLRGAEYFCLIRPKGDALVLETLFLAEDVRSQAEIDEAVAGTQVKDAEEQSMEEFVLGMDFALMEMESETLRKIDDALLRLDDGHYGTCTECDEAISDHLDKVRAKSQALQSQDTSRLAFTITEAIEEEVRSAIDESLGVYDAAINRPIAPNARWEQALLKQIEFAVDGAVIQALKLDSEKHPWKPLLSEEAPKLRERLSAIAEAHFAELRKDRKTRRKALRKGTTTLRAPRGSWQPAL